jgi:hypothetical protein
MSKKNRFHKRQEKRCRVYCPSLRSNEIAEYNPDTRKVEITNLAGGLGKHETRFLQSYPTFSDIYNLVPGSAQEYAHLDALMRQGVNRFEDLPSGVELA